ncbi:MAG TPA: hypothetical protein VGP98_11455 [Pyrinomonadaceae bacterium]|jgi:hypothetical protein|nr:hypothetical protein [Pyrinomonadaceae bacterium]
MITPTIDEETREDDVNYGIADCRRRMRSQRSSLRAQDHPPKDGSNGDVRSAPGRVGSFAEVLANVSMNQSSLSRLVECLLEPVDDTPSHAETMEQEEAVIT